jgi:hypothetical protein
MKMSDDSVEVRLARLELSLGHLEINGAETRKGVEAIREILDVQAPRWSVIAERVENHSRIMWAIALPSLAALGAGLWSVAHLLR